MNNSTPFHNSFRFLSANGFEHIMTIEADTYPELLSRIAEAEADILHSKGVPLMSANLRPSWELTNGGTTPPAPAPAQEKPNSNGHKTEPQYEPFAEDLPDGQHLFPVKEVFHDTNQGGDKHFVKVVIDGDYEYGNGNWGIAMFKNADKLFPGWKNWKKGQRYSPPTSAAYVVVEDPAGGGKYANIVEFRSA